MPSLMKRQGNIKNLKTDIWSEKFDLIDWSIYGFDQKSMRSILFLFDTLYYYYDKVVEE